MKAIIRKSFLIVTVFTLVFLCFISFENNIEILSQDSPIMSTLSSDSVNIDLMGNRLKNSTLNYNAGSSTIPNWSIHATNSINGDGIKSTKIGTTISNGFRRLDSFTSYHFINANPSGGVFKAKSVGNNNERTAYYVLSQVTQLVVGKEYYLRADVSSTNGSSNISLIVYPGSNISGSNSLASASNLSVNSRQVVELKFTASQSNVSLTFRHFRNTNSNIVLNIHALGFYLKDDYELQNEINDIFSNLDLVDLKFDDIEKIQAKIDAINSKIESQGSIYSADILTYVQEGVIKAQELLDEYKSVYENINSFYSDKSEAKLKTPLSKEEIETLKSEVSKYEGTTFYSDFIAEIDEIDRIYELDNRKKVEIESIQNESLSKINEIQNSLHLSQVEKDEMIRQINENLEESISKINNSKNDIELNVALNDYENNFNNIVNDYVLRESKIKQKSLIEIDAQKMIDMVNSLSYLSTDLKNEYINQITITKNKYLTMIDGATSLEAVNSIGKEAISVINDIYLVAYQVDSKLEIEKYYNKMLSVTNNLENIDSSNLSIINDALLEIKNEAITTAHLINSVDEISVIKSTAINDLFESTLNAKKTDSLILVEEIIANNKNNSNEDDLSLFLQNFENNLNNQTSFNGVEFETSKILEEIDVYLKKEAALNLMTSASLNLKNYIDSSTHLTENEKLNYKLQLDNILSVQTQNLNNANKSSINQIVNETLLQFDNLEFIVYRQNELNKTIEYSNGLLNKIDELTFIGLEDQEMYKQVLLSEISNLEKNILNYNNASDLNQVIEQVKNKMSNSYLNAFRADKTFNLEIIKDNQIQVILDLENIHEEQEIFLIDKINNYYETFITHSSTLTSTEAIENAFKYAEEEINKVVANAHTIDFENLNSVINDYKSDINLQKNNLIDEVLKLEYLDETQKQAFINNINSIYDLAIEELENATTISDTHVIFRNYSDLLINEFNEAIKLNSKLETTNKIELYYNNLINDLNELEYLDTNELNNYYETLTTIKDNAILNLGSESNLELDYENAIKNLNTEFNDAFRKDHVNAITLTYENVLKDIEQLELEDDSTFKSKIDEILTSTITDIYNDDFIMNVPLITQNGIIEMLSVLEETNQKKLSNIDSTRSNIKNQIINKTQQAIDEILNMTHLSENEKNVFINDLNKQLDNRLTELDLTSDLIEMESIKDDAFIYIDDTLLKANKQNAKNEIQNFVNQLLNGAESNNEVAEKILQIFNNIDNTTNIESLNDIVENGKVELSNLLLVELNNVKDRVRAELSEHVNFDQDPVILGIIESYVNRVDYSNYSNDEIINNLINDGKIELDAYYQSLIDLKKESLKEELITYSNSNLDDEVLMVINSTLNEINISNYNDEVEIEQIKNNAIAIIDEIVLDNFKEEKISELNAFVEKLYNNELPSHVSEKLNDFINQINEADNKEEVINYFDNAVAYFNNLVDIEYNQTINDILEIFKSEAGLIFDELSKDLTNIIDEINKNNYRDQELINKVIENGKNIISKNLLEDAKNKALSDLKYHFNIYVKSPLYNEKGILEINEIYFNYQDKITISNDIELVNEYILSAIEEFNAVKIYEIKNGDFNIFDQELKLNENQIIAGIRNEDGIDKSHLLSIEKLIISQEDKTKIEDLINQNSFRVFNHISLEEYKLYMLNQKLIAGYDINIVNNQGFKVTNLSGLYKVSIRLENELLNLDELRVIYLTNDNLLEIKNVQKNGKWLTFETNHFSNFYITYQEKPVVIIEKPIEVIVEKPIEVIVEKPIEVIVEKPIDFNGNLLWLIPTLVVTIIGLVICILLKKKELNRKVHSTLLPILLISFLESNILVIINVLILIVILLIIYLIYLFIKAGNANVNYNINNISTVNNVNNINYEEKTLIYVDAKQSEIVPSNETEIHEVVEEQPEEMLMLENNSIFNYSFEARMHQAPLESQLRYSEIKNYALSFPHTKVSSSWKYERIMYKGKPVFKARIHGKKLKLYFNLDYNLYVDSRINLTDLREKVSHEHTPILLTVIGTRTTKHAIELIDDYFKDKEVLDPNYKHKDFTVKFISKKKLINMGLIKTMKRSKNI